MRGCGYQRRLESFGRTYRRWSRGGRIRGGAALTEVSATYRPRARADGVVYPIIVSSNLLSFAVGNAVVETPLPDVHWADRDGRWTYIAGQLLPVYNNLMKNRPELWRATLAAPVSVRITEQRMIARLPDMLRSMTSILAITVN
ncbi:hypothetical protein QM716_18335 [Rhodococcus sp. IEGM 1409]|uniref:hypothetical protein n=1 Tax=Rhodococcus sp. IEGM 1409 TaxID=3047082 RepID=UPI0024B672F0|nr:hypothetical protein [Rhodococcus sp. IEGM 1409]MDI9901815.1 hypothetical protein [Rhodococcus sp. IEGM 1409]